MVFILDILINVIGIPYMNQFVSRCLVDKLKQEVDIANDTYKLLSQWQKDKWRDIETKIVDLATNQETLSVEFKDLKNYFKKKILLLLVRKYPLI